MEKKTFFVVRRHSIVLGLTTAFLGLGIIVVFLVTHLARLDHENRSYADGMVVIADRIAVLEAQLAEVENYSNALDRLTKPNTNTTKLVSNTENGNQKLEHSKNPDAGVVEEITLQTMRLKQMSDHTSKLQRQLQMLSSIMEHRTELLTSLPSISPVTGVISSYYGARTSPFTGQKVVHRGIDVSAAEGSDVVASAAGVVIFSGIGRDLGKFVTIDHGYGIMTKYGHNSVLKVKEGEKVYRGQIIALVGNTGHSTGPHSHYEIWVNNEAIDPLKFMPDLLPENPNLAMKSPLQNMGGAEDLMVQASSSISPFTKQLSAKNLGGYSGERVAPKSKAFDWTFILILGLLTGTFAVVAVAFSFTRSEQRSSAYGMTSVNSSEKNDKNRGLPFKL